MNIRRQVLAILDSTSYPVYGLWAPSTASTPYVRFQIVSDVPGHTHAGHDGTAETRVQVSCFSSSYAGAGDLAGDVFVAVTESTLTNGIRISRKVNELDMYDEESRVYHIPIDFILSHVEYST